MVSGRLKEHDREAIRERLLEWAQKDDSLNLLEFSAQELIPASYLLRFSKENEIFCTTFELVKNILGARRERKLLSGDLHVKAYHLNATTYDRHMKEEVQDMMTFEAKLKAELSDSIPEDIKDQYVKLMTQITKLQTKNKIDQSKKK